MPASTSTPMAMAMPESDMMFDVMPNWFIRMNETRIESGSGKRDDEDAAEMEQEQNDDDRDQHGFLGQRVFERVERAVNQLAAVVKGFDADARRQAGRDLRDLGLHVADDLHGIFAGAHDDDAADDFMSVNVERAAPEIAADLHGRHVLEINRRAAALRQHDVFQVGVGID